MINKKGKIIILIVFAIILMVIIGICVYKSVFNKELDSYDNLAELDSNPINNVYYSKKLMVSYCKWKYGDKYYLANKNDFKDNGMKVTRYEFKSDDNEKFYIYTNKETNYGYNFVPTKDWHTKISSFYIDDIMECHREEIRNTANKYGLEIEEFYSEANFESHKPYGFLFINVKLKDIKTIAKCLVDINKLLDLNINIESEEKRSWYYFNGYGAEVPMAINNNTRNTYNEKYYEEKILEVMEQYQDLYNF